MPSFREMLATIERNRERSMRGEGGIALDDPTRGAHVIDPSALAPSDSLSWMSRITREFIAPTYLGSDPAATQSESIGVREPFTITAGLSWYEDAERSATRREPPTPPKAPTTIAVQAQPPDAEYAALAQELGVSTAAVDVERFKAWINDHGLRVYQRAEVQAYLHHQYSVPPHRQTLRVHWGWRPLRTEDRRPRANDREQNGVVQYAAEPYAKAIPYPVLLTIKAIRDDFPAARFYVSDDLHAEQIPDPFLLVQIGREEFVVERWDEPAFRSKA